MPYELFLQTYFSPWKNSLGPNSSFVSPGARFLGWGRTEKFLHFYLLLLGVRLPHICEGAYAIPTLDSYSVDYYSIHFLQPCSKLGLLLSQDYHTHFAFGTQVLKG